MEAKLEIHQIEIIVRSAGDPLSALGAESLTRAGVVPEDWEVADEQPEYPGRIVSSVLFANGVGFLVRSNELRFAQVFGSQELDKTLMPKVAADYLVRFGSGDYFSVAIEIRGHVEVTREEDAATYLVGRLLGDGPWKEIDFHPIDASFTLAYVLDSVVLDLDIRWMVFQVGEEESKPVIRFLGSFEHEISDGSSEVRLGKVLDVINGWRADLDHFRDIVNERFLAKEGPQ